MPHILAAVLSVGLASLAVPVAAAPTPRERTALARVKAYTLAHNRHDLASIMGFYADDAVFKLNGGRPLVEGKSQIAALELFDVMAGSNVSPRGLSARMEGDDVMVSSRTVVEHSAVFKAVGLDRITTESIDAFLVKPDGEFSYVAQADFLPSCSEVAGKAFTGTLQWLASHGDARSAQLMQDGRLMLTSDRISILLSAIRDWRRTTRWSPDADLARQCSKGL